MGPGNRGGDSGDPNGFQNVKEAESDEAGVFVRFFFIRTAETMASSRKREEMSFLEKKTREPELQATRILG